ncbi:Probable bifunctional methylthioribulose-1-phosphate dehydratase/enolase-phosphatase E1 [Includes: Methylthioribulose-1-phosphate dehydratase (MTRu-1-P dehydratase) [Durusdinium trenchii]|uniref:Acireductone dioxygenase n=1 Tax=Durusdinium trenchii TaxID=1381693 RepID=A0ABP0QZW2_9DINO
MTGAVTISDLRDLGVIHWHIPPVGDYPAKAVPWEPKDGIQDKQLAAIRESRGYNYADIITCSEECLPDYHNKLKAFFEEHIHSDEEVRYILKGSGYFDVRDLKDRWIRIRLSAGDLIVLPEGIYHRFTMDTKNFTHAMRLFKGVPVWTPINRPADTHLSRERYLQRFQPLEEELSLRSTIVSCLRGFFAQGWCLGSSGAMACRVTSKASGVVNAPVLVTPSGVPKEQLQEEDLFLLAAGSGELLKLPTKSAPKAARLTVSRAAKVSDSAAVFQAVFERRSRHIRAGWSDVTAICHIHSVPAIVAAENKEVLGGDPVLRIRDSEMIKGLGVSGDGVLVVPIIDNKALATEPDLVPDLIRALQRIMELMSLAALQSNSVAEWSREEVVEAPRKRLRRGPAVVLLDVEGTTTPISFVKARGGANVGARAAVWERRSNFRDCGVGELGLSAEEKLFPYAATAVDSWIQTANLADVAKEFEKQCKEDFCPAKCGRQNEEVLRLTKEWIAKDRKVPALKDLQGKLWKAGYEKGELKGEMFEDQSGQMGSEDTPEAMAAWVAAGKRVAIFSSGSREAQRLIYQYSDKGDLTSYLSAYFDPKSAQASKQEAKAYEEIALSMGINPSEGLFCTDVLGEAQAARKAGWQAVLLKRPGNAPLPESHGFREATSLLDV